MSLSVTSPKPFTAFVSLSQPQPCAPQLYAKDDKEKFAQAVEKSDGFSSSVSNSSASQSKQAYVDWMRGKCKANEQQHAVIIEIIKTLNKHNWATTCEAMLIPISPKLNASWEYFYKEIFELVAVFPSNRDVKEAIANIINSFSRKNSFSKEPSFRLTIKLPPSSLVREITEFSIAVTNVTLGVEIIRKIKGGNGKGPYRLRNCSDFLPSDTCETFKRCLKNEHPSVVFNMQLSFVKDNLFDKLLTAVKSLRAAIKNRINLQKDQHSCDDDVQLRQQAMMDEIQLEQITEVYKIAFHKHKSQESFNKSDNNKKDAHSTIIENRVNILRNAQVEVQSKTTALKITKLKLLAINVAESTYNAAKQELPTAVEALFDATSKLAAINKSLIEEAQSFVDSCIKADADARAKAEADAKAKIAADTKAAVDAKTKAAADAKIKAEADIKNAENMFDTAVEGRLVTKHAKIAADKALAEAMAKNALNTNVVVEADLKANAEKATRAKEEADKVHANARTTLMSLFRKQAAAQVAAGT